MRKSSLSGGIFRQGKICALALRVAPTNALAPFGYARNDPNHSRTIASRLELISEKHGRGRRAYPYAGDNAVA